MDVCLQIYIISLLAFCKDLCEAKHEMQSVFKFSDVFFALKSDGLHPPIDEALSQVDIFVKFLGLWSDILPSRGIWWPVVVLHQVSLTFGKPLGQADLWSDVPPSRGI